MKTRFSLVTGSFYPHDIDYGAKLPADLIEVSLEDYEAAMARPVGYSFTFINGRLVITAPAPVPFANLAAAYMGEVRTMRDKILNILAGIGMAAVVAKDEAIQSAVIQSRQQLLDLPQSPQVDAAMVTENLDALQEAVKVRYKEIAAAAPLALRTAFNQVAQ